MTETLFRADALVLPEQPNRVRVAAPAGLHVQDGRIRRAGPLDDFRGQSFDAECQLDGVVAPGFVDVHIHWVQHAVRGAFHGELLEWLRNDIWPEEARYGDPVLTRERAVAFARDMLRAGTTAGIAYSSPHVRALQEGLSAVRGRWRMGNAVMTRNAPDELTRASIHDLEVLRRVAESVGLQRYILTPRFALNVSEDFLSAMGALSRDLNLFVQTHLAESTAECRAVGDAFPTARDYTDIYDRAGLLGPRTLLGHCIHMSPREFDCLRERRCWIAHCPSSNEALGSGRMDLAAVRRHRLPFALGSDVGAGPSHSMLHVMQRFMAQHREAGVSVTGEEALYRATAAGAHFLGLADGAPLQAGTQADFVLLPASDGQFQAGPWLESVTRGSPAELESRVLGTWIAGARLY